MSVIEKIVVDNNFLSSTSSAKRDELAEKVKKGDKTLQTAKEFLELENADQRSDALVALFNSDPAAMTAGEKVELASYLRIYAAEMQAQYGDAVTKELITGMLTGQDYLKFCCRCWRWCWYCSWRYWWHHNKRRNVESCKRGCF
ncbi:hypothetical protein [Gibbsiella quercinecans]|uniref:hypothetical protein n=1 Tax=Gibbsiella quercinecans TaxID=929813 RepID=UPI003A4DB413